MNISRFLSFAMYLIAKQSHQKWTDKFVLIIPQANTGHPRKLGIVALCYSMIISANHLYWMIISANRSSGHISVIAL